jgi:predicted RNA polymerase sigma factor
MWYVNFRGRGDLLIRLGRSDEAREVLTSAIAEIEDLQSAGELPQGLEPETMGEMNVMRNLLGSL